MKTKKIVGLVAITGFLALLLISFGQQVGEYVNFSEAAERDIRVHVVGEWVQHDQTHYNPEENLFSFYMQDDEGEVRQVQYHDVMPASFEDAEKIVVEGRLQEGVFVAEHILMKCPSKYNNERVLQSPTKGNV